MNQIRAAVPVNVMDSHCITCPWYGVKLSKTKSALFSLFAGDAVRDDNVGVPYAFHDALGGAREQAYFYHLEANSQQGNET